MDYDRPINNQDKNLAINFLLMDQSNTKSMLYNPTTNTRRIREREKKKSQMSFRERIFKDFLPLSICFHSCLQRYNPTLLNFSLIQKQHALEKKKKRKQENLIFDSFIHVRRATYQFTHQSFPDYLQAQQQHHMITSPSVVLMNFLWKRLEFQYWAPR